MKQWFLGLSERDRNVLLAGTGIAIIIIVLSFSLSVFDRVQKSQQRVDNKQETLLWLKQQAAEINVLRGQSSGATRTDRRSPQVKIDQAASEQGLQSAVRQVQSIDQNKLRVQIKDAQFDKLVAMLSSLGTTYQLEIDSISLNDTDRSGVVDARITLVQPGA